MPGRGPGQQAFSRSLGWQCVSGDLLGSPAHLAQIETLMLRRQLSVL